MGRPLTEDDLCLNGVHTSCVKERVDASCTKPADENEIARVATWIRVFCQPARRTNRSVTSYTWKHLAEYVLAPRFYVANGTFIAAAIRCGYTAKQHGDGPNADIAIRFAEPKRKIITLENVLNFTGSKDLADLLYCHEWRTSDGNLTYTRNDKRRSLHQATKLTIRETILPFLLRSGWRADTGGVTTDPFNQPVRYSYNHAAAMQILWDERCRNLGLPLMRYVWSINRAMFITNSSK